MKGIKVTYKPLLSLKPTHIAILCVLEQPSRIQELSERLPLPDVVLEHTCEELSFWQLVARNGEGLELTSNGRVALAVLRATEKNGFWECEDDGRWVLGEGRFELPDTLTDLDSAGWDSETGEVLSEAAALNAIKERQSTLAASDAYASKSTCVSELGTALKDGGKIEQAVESIMARTFSALHLNRVSDQLAALLSNGDSPKENNAGPLKVIFAKKNARLRQIQRLQRDGQRAIWVMLAQWFRQRNGVLGELVRQRPSAFRCVSTIGSPLWEEEREPATPAFSRFEQERSDTTESGGGFLSWLGDMVSSILR